MLRLLPSIMNRGVRCPINGKTSTSLYSGSLARRLLRLLCSPVAGSQRDHMYLAGGSYLKEFLLPLTSSKSRRSTVMSATAVMISERHHPIHRHSGGQNRIVAPSRWPALWRSRRVRCAPHDAKPPFLRFGFGAINKRTDSDVRSRTACKAPPSYLPSKKPASAWRALPNQAAQGHTQFIHQIKA